MKHKQTLSMTTRLILFLTLVSVLPLMVVGVASYNVSRSVIQKNVSNYTLALMVEQKNYLELILEQVESLITNVSGVEDIREVINDEEQHNHDDAYAELATHAKIGYILSNYASLNGLVSIDIFSPGGAHYHVGDTLNVQEINQETLSRIYTQALASDELILWTGVEDNVNANSNHQKVVTAAKLLGTLDTESLEERPAALLLVHYSTHSLHDHFSHLDLGSGAYAMIVDTQDRLVFHPDERLIGSHVSPDFLSRLDAGEGSLVTGVEGQRMFVTYTTSEMSGWRLVSLVPYQNLAVSARAIFNTTLTILAISAVFIVWVAVWFTRTTVRPVKRITELFKQIQQGTFDEKERLPEERGGEIGELVRWFNTFLDSLEAQRKAENERAKMEKALRESEERFRALVETSTDWIWETGPDSVYTYASPAVARILGYEPEDLIGKTPFDLMPPGEAERMYALFQEAVAVQGHIERLENVNQHVDGHRVVLETSSVPVLSDDGEFAGYRGIDRDITARRQAEEALRESQAKYRDLVENLSVVVYTLDLEGAVTYISPAIESFLGYRPAEIEGHPFREFVYPDDLGRLLESYTDVMAGQPVGANETRILTRAGDIRWIHTAVRPTVVEDQVTGLQGTLWDITSRKNAEAELAQYREQLEVRVQERTVELQTRVAEVEQLNRAMTNVLEDLQEANTRIADTARHLREANAELESFSYSVSHDLRAPLRHIDGFVRLLEKRLGDKLDGDSARYVDVIRASVGKMSQLIEDLLALSRTGRTEMRWQRVDLGHIVNAIRHDLVTETEDRQIEWQVAPLPVVEGDPTLLRQVWANLLSNAVKYTAPREQARIEIGVLEPEENSAGEVTVYVRDNGVGFDPQYGHKLFGVFQRLHQADEFEGTGIGLAIVRRIIYRHGGRVWAKGRPDQGATFYITLRAADAQIENRLKQETSTT